jgi:hypothetical protein
MRGRAAFVTCLAATLIVVGALARVLSGPFGIAPRMLDTALADGVAGAEVAILRGNPAARILPDVRRTGPALDSGSSATVIPAAVANALWAAADDLERQVNPEASSGSPLRFAHRPRGPPCHGGTFDQPKHLARLLIPMSRNCGANFPDGLHLT